jgi:D-3-phosphoglycerate dehydrogenase
MKLAILDDYQRVALASADWGRLERRGVEITIFHEAFASVDDAVRQLAPFEILCLMRERTAFPRALVERLPNLKFVSLTGLRAGTLDSKALGERGIPVSNTRAGASTGLTAELCWGLIIMAARGLAQGERNMRSGRWHESIPRGFALEGKRLGLMGLGKIGARVGAIGKAFGMHVQAWSQNLTPERAAEAGAQYVPKDELFATSDVLSLHLVLSERTRGIVGRPDLERMKPGAVLVNVSRGPLVDEAALLDGLRKGHPAHAALDVYDREPLPADHPLRALDNVTLSPHLGYVNDENLKVFYEDSVENVEAWLSGRPVRVMNAEFLRDSR